MVEQQEDCNPLAGRYIPKADGKQRPLAIAALEEEHSVQANVMQAQCTLMKVTSSASPGRGPHDALDALSTAIKRRKVNWRLTPTSRTSSELSAKSGWSASSNIGPVTSASLA